MSVVGPRPVVKDELELYGQAADCYLRTRPGLTGLWQVSGRNDVSYGTRVAFDQHYVENWSFVADIKIICAHRSRRSWRRAAATDRRHAAPRRGQLITAAVEQPRGQASRDDSSTTARPRRGAALKLLRAAAAAFALLRAASRPCLRASRRLSARRDGQAAHPRRRMAHRGGCGPRLVVDQRRLYGRPGRQHLAAVHRRAAG